jgi:hypothetical protein
MSRFLQFAGVGVAMPSALPINGTSDAPNDSRTPPAGLPSLRTFAVR